ncbi:hypothetical protein KUTeg_005464 [Tegillarca granosa]|uniref:Nanos-type domain-containing protein n=1 Tax=Tegillarca granosa TaxID=220873 RepID=A0ABQ9FMS4_TEGGR|nr:hypothetical protein KUTeg_005464 [Tegillarca granosa]
MSFANFENIGCGQYDPLGQDYLGLCDVTWNKDLLLDLEKIMSCDVSMEDRCSGSDGETFNEYESRSYADYHETCLGISVNDFDPLEVIRSDSLEDFRHNGRECDLDELDSYQVELRHKSARDRFIIQQENNPVVLEVLAFKEKKKAQRKAKAKKVCVFCKNNGETSSVYTAHVLKDGEGRVCCPVLRKYTCPICGISGDEAHTIKYCPRNDGESASLSLLKTTRLSTGKKRRLP